jgi:hypothetical protein
VVVQGPVSSNSEGRLPTTPSFQPTPAANRAGLDLLEGELYRASIVEFTSGGRTGFMDRVLRNAARHRHDACQAMALVNDGRCIQLIAG